MEDVPLAIRQRMFFMLDGAPCHYHVEVRDFLNAEFPERWIGREGAIAWPPRSPDLTPMNFYLWGFMKNIVYGPGRPEIENIYELRQRVHEAAEQVRQQNAMERACQSLIRLCIECSSENFEHLL